MVLAAIRVRASSASTTHRWTCSWRERVAQLQAGGEAKRWIALLPDPELPKNSQVLIKWGPGLPSAEGPRVTDKPAIQSFRTYGPLGLVQARCGWDADCPPLLPWTLEFSNPIDAKRFNPSWIRVEPPIAQQKVQVHGSVLTLSGMSRGRTAYQISGTLGGDLDFAKQQALFVRIHNAAKAPATCDASLEGGLYYDTTLKQFFGCNGSKWRAFTAGMNSQANPAASCLAVLQSGEGKVSGLYWLKPPKAAAARQVYCDQTSAGGGWALVLHVYNHTGMSENKFTAAVGHNRFTDANWNLVGGNLVVGAGAASPGPGKTTGAVDIAFFEGCWTDLRAACSQKTGDLTEQAFGVVTGFTIANGNAKLLGAATNGKSYSTDKT